MKDQYVADIGDYGKYSMLREFALSGVSVGVNWYYTKNDEPGSTDGKFREYLTNDKNRIGEIDSEVYQALQKINDKGERRSIRDVEAANVIPRALYYSELLSPEGKPAERARQRDRWFFRGLSELRDADLVFLDPDNGLLVNGDATKRNAEKYILSKEVEQYFMNGSNVVFYCHKGRRKDSVWEVYKRTVFERAPYAVPMAVTFHKGTQRTYIFAVHEKDVENYRGILEKVIGKWNGAFTEEKIDTSVVLKQLYEGLREFEQRGVPHVDVLQDFFGSHGMLIYNYGDFFPDGLIDVTAELRKLPTADLLMCSALMTAIFREDHFDNFSFAHRCENGDVQKVIRRMMEVIEASMNNPG